MKRRIALFASGSGTNAQRISEYFRDHPLAEVVLILSNSQDAYVLQRAEKLGIPTHVFTAAECKQSHSVLAALSSYKVDFLVLAGFLLLVPLDLINAYPDAIVNIHPALLPDFGGKGMYGRRVHEAVLASGVSESGISIHYVNEKYDAGSIIFQARCPVLREDTVESLAHRIHQLEYEHYPRIIESLLL